MLMQKSHFIFVYPYTWYLRTLPIHWQLSAGYARFRRLPKITNLDILTHALVGR